MNISYKGNFGELENIAITDMRNGKIQRVSAVIAKQYSYGTEFETIASNVRLDEITFHNSDKEVVLFPVEHFAKMSEQLNMLFKENQRLAAENTALEHRLKKKKEKLKKFKILQGENKALKSVLGIKTNVNVCDFEEDKQEEEI